MDNRYDRLVHWLGSIVGDNVQLQALAGDASFRCYYRVLVNGQNMIAMDACPERENNHAFVAIGQTFRQLGLKVPEIYHVDFEQGFFLGEDFGDFLLLDELNNHNCRQLYRHAIDQLFLLQRCQSVDNYSIARFDRGLMRRELDLFRDWYLQRQLGLTLTDADHQSLNAIFDVLIETILQQPVICVHRDFHSRNLMLLSGGELGVLDFQDAVWGPVTYDLVSLLKDCYVAWPRDMVEEMVYYYYEKAAQNGNMDLPTMKHFLQWFDCMGIQRHLKAIGIFARLNKCYGKPNYLQDIPRTLNYLEEAVAGFGALSPLTDFLYPLHEHRQ